MIGPVHPRRRRLPLTPLIDVIFLLLLFFMLSSTFLRFGSVEVAATGPAEGRAAEGATALIKLRHDGTLSLNGEPVALRALAAALDDLTARGTARVLVTTERGGSVQDLVAALEMLEAGPLPVVLSAGLSAP